MITTRTLVLFVTLVAVLAGGIASASAAPLACGDQLTDDRKLRADLDCSTYAGPALTIDANGVTLDLNGHTIIGPDDQNGIYAADRRRNVTIKNGTISGFYHAVEMLDGGRDLKLSGLKLVVQDTTGAQNAMGAYLGDFRHVRMDHLRIRNANYGLYVFNSKDVVVRDSRIRAGTATGQTMGVNIDTDVNNTGMIDHVTATGATYGFFIGGPTTGFTITDNTANDGGRGFNIANLDDPRAYTIKRNTANDNDNYGFYAANRVRRSAGNHASGNGVQDCFRVKCASG